MKFGKLYTNQKGFTLVEAIISMGLIFLMVFTVSTLAMSYSKYQTRRLERAHVQENFRSVLNTITVELQNLRPNQVLEPALKSASFELFYLFDSNNDGIDDNVVQYMVEKGHESQIFRKVYNFSVMPTLDNWNDIKESIISSEPVENEPVSDKIKALSQLLFVNRGFTGKNEVAIFIVGELSDKDKTKVSYVSLVKPRRT